MTKLTWVLKSNSKDFQCSTLTLSDGSDLYETAMEQRHLLIDNLAELSEHMMEIVMSTTNYDNISADVIRQCIAEVTRNNKASPVLLGSMLKNVAVQPLLDAVVDYLPGPEVNNTRFSNKDQLCAFAFKTVHQKERGALTFIRLYNGSLSSSSTVYNATKECNDKIGKIYTILADQMIETKITQAGIL